MAVQVVGMERVMDLGSVEEDKEVVDAEVEEQIVSAVSVGFLAATAEYPAAMHKDKVKRIFQILGS
ncbi:hypothetical protein TMatcc_003957 [Talaromyces marneffei ATCC 18224]